MKWLLLKLIHLYQYTNLSYGVCRFSPTCSNYTLEAIEKYGSAKGLWMGLTRIIRCHPWSRGGYDPA